MPTTKTDQPTPETAGKTEDSYPQLKVRVFGPIRECVLPVRDLMVLIGEQASGKSTLAKLLYFFQSLPELVEQDATRLAQGDPFKNWVKLLRQRFMDSFGTTKHLPTFDIEYHYTRSVWLRLTQENVTGHARVDHEARLQAAIVERIEIETEVRRASEDPASPAEDPLRMGMERPEVAKREAASGNLRRLTGCEAARVFIPSARSLLSVLSTDLLYNDLRNLDPLIHQFVRRIDRLQQGFATSLEDQLENAIHASLRDVPVEQRRVEKAILLVRSVLKGSYVYDRGKERIEMEDGQHVYLRFASSGQQEALWILLLLFWIILQRTPASVIMEEPEAHLFPFAQRDVIELVALCKNVQPAPRAPRNGIVLTTHSPYVLAALNNLMYAHQVAARGPAEAEKVGAVVDAQLWLDPADVGVWLVENGTIRSIVDPELQLIQAEQIDGVSTALREAFDRLEEIESA